MREIKTSNPNSVVKGADIRVPGGANHLYSICLKEPGDQGRVCFHEIVINFQRGGVVENGVNGIQNEDLLAILIDRMRGFQSGLYNCRENAMVITKLEEAMHWLNHRTNDRIDRGVEGREVE
jgi:hypothetical protein